LIDSTEDTREEWWRNEVHDTLNLTHTILVSARTGYNIPELRDYIYSICKEGVWEAPSGLVDFRTPREILADTLNTVIFR